MGFRVVQGRLDFEGLGCGVCVYIHIYIYMFTYTRNIYVYIFTTLTPHYLLCFSHIYMFVCLFVCMYAYTHTHTHTHQGTPRPLEVGAAVEIHSLQKSLELNGARGELVKSQDLGTGRFGVKTATGRELALKPVNLRLIGALTGPAAGAADDDACLLVLIQ